MLRAFGGCFDWKSQRPDFVEVAPVSNGSCSTEAILSVHRSAHPIHDKTWILAHDQNKAELRCEVHVAPIASLTIDAPTKSIGVGAVETLSLRGFDQYGNVFSSLEHLWFKWISSNTGRGNIHPIKIPLYSTAGIIRFFISLYPEVLAFVSLDADIYRASPSRLLVQQDGGQPDVVLLRGVSSGRMNHMILKV